MLLRLTTATIAAATTAGVSVFTITVSRQFSNTSILPKPFSNIPWRHRSKAIQEAQTALIDYLHTTRSMPFVYAENIATSSPNSLGKIVSKIPFSPSTFSKSFQRFLRYHPVNELDLFLESIGLNVDENGNPLFCMLAKNFFLSDCKQFDSACALAGIGFPWCKLGLLCREECLILDFDKCVLKRRFNEIKDAYGLSSVNVIGICLVWPRVLSGEMDDLLKDMKIAFVDYGLAGSVEDTVDAMLEVCNKLRLIYDLGCEFGKVGELIGKSKRVLVDYSEEALVRKIEYFCKLNVRKDEIVLFLLSRSEIFGFDMEKRVISVKGFLEHFGLRGKDLTSLEQKYPHVFGRNKITNLPNVMRSLDLGVWFFEKMKNGDHSLFSTYTLRHSKEGLDKIYENNLIKIQAKRTHFHSMVKLDFLHRVGFGENKFAVKAFVRLNSSGSQLQQRFDYLLSCGIGYSSLCAMVKHANILNQQEPVLKQKLDFLCIDMRSSFKYLDIFPGYLCYDLEKRIKPRYEIHKWLVEEGFCKIKYSIATIVATSEKKFNARISRICSGKVPRELANQKLQAICLGNLVP
ncbi:hypothetical protein F511_15363 [Dorcoceras hygrometricum]|uniref:Mitochondrial transcription termination factor family protein n=1 Tax=Dorcoceras hygrometricum TaxID=472368 RepID=A0A2Z7C3U3_9LAMI|nr:hypothetical protein F511_15363 [Dorcoceras hygrometricum]